MATYTKADILDKIKYASADMSTFYDKAFINYRGKAKDSGEYYSEIIAEWCCDNLTAFNSIRRITRSNSYYTSTHSGIHNNSKSKRVEEILAMEIYNKGKLDLLGDILDYQTPLKDKMRPKAGKIDLLSYDGKTLRILELKKCDSKETMLRCVLEAFTYFKIVDITKLINDFNKGKNKEIPLGVSVEACPLIFLEGAQCKEMQEGRPELEKLMKALSVKPYYIYSDSESYKVVDDCNFTKQ